MEPEPFFGATEEEQRECTLGFLQATPLDAILVSIDGGPAVNVGLDSFIAVSGQGTVDLPNPNILGVPGNREATFVASATWRWFGRCPRGPTDHRDDRWRPVRWVHHAGDRQRRAGR